MPGVRWGRMQDACSPFFISTRDWNLLNNDVYRDVFAVLLAQGGDAWREHDWRAFLRDAFGQRSPARNIRRCLNCYVRLGLAVWHRTRRHSQGDTRDARLSIWGAKYSAPEAVALVADAFRTGFFRPGYRPVPSDDLLLPPDWAQSW